MAGEEFVLLTGGSGYIGSAIIEKISSDYKVISLDTSLPRKKIMGVDYRNFDITSEEKIKESLSRIKEEHGDKIKSVIHLAAYYNFNGEESPKYQQVNVQGTSSFLASLKELFTVKQFIFPSSMLVYAPSQPGQKIKEESALAPSWAYPKSKLQAENVLKKEHAEIPIVILRIAAVYNDVGYAPTIAQQILRIYETQFTSFLFPGNEKHVQSGIHIDDLVDVFSLVIEKEGQLPAEITLSVAEEKTPTFEQLQSRIGELLYDKAWPVVNIPKPFAKFGAKLMGLLPASREAFIKPWMIQFSDANYDLDITRLEQVLNWHPKKDLLGTLPKMIALLKENPDRWYYMNKLKKAPKLAEYKNQLFKQILVHQH